jgi:hypothetical protein
LFWYRVVWISEEPAAANIALFCFTLSINNHTLKTYGGVEVWIHAFLTLTLGRIEWSVLRPGHLIFCKRALVHIKMLCGPLSLSERCGGEKSFASVGDRTWFLGRRAHSMVTIVTELCHLLNE